MVPGGSNNTLSHTHKEANLHTLLTGTKLSRNTECLEEVSDDLSAEVRVKVLLKCLILIDPIPVSQLF